MDLKELRDEIDKIDDEMAVLFEKRTKIAADVAEYKRQNNLPIFQGGREEEVLKRAESHVSDELKSGARLFFTTLMDISKCRQQQLLTKPASLHNRPEKENPIVGTVTKGSYSSEACLKLCGKDCNIRYFNDFSEVFKAVESGEIAYGAIPIENSTAGDVSSTYDFMTKYKVYICKSTTLRISHVLAARKGTKLSDIKKVMSHEMALKQCSRFIKKNGFEQIEYCTTAGAAEAIANSDMTDTAALCSAYCAELFGLEILAENITDIDDNFTRFILISHDVEISEKSNVVSLCLTVPHTAGSLYRLLTKFAYCGLNLCRIESRPVPRKLAALKDDAFDFIFYLDFIGSANDENVVKLLTSLEKEMKYYRFLGNYEEV